MPILVQRTIIKFGNGGLVVTIPKAWADYHKLVPGDKVEMKADHNLVIKIKRKRES